MRTLNNFCQRWYCSRISAILEAILSGHLPSRHYWTLNLYSNGRTLKRSAGLSRFRKIKVSTDHGLSFAVNSVQGEEQIPASLHLTWSQWRDHPDFSNSRQTLLIEHPWISYRKARGYRPLANRAGTIVFVSHSVPGKAAPLLDVSSIIDQVEANQDLPRPLVYCFHMHDFRLGIHKEFQNRGRKVATLGNTLSPFFVDRFYRTIRNFEVLLSFTTGTQVLLGYEFGLKSVISPLVGQPLLGKVSEEHKGNVSMDAVEEFVRAFGLTEDPISRTKRDEWLLRGLSCQIPVGSTEKIRMRPPVEIKQLAQILLETSRNSRKPRRSKHG